MNKNDLKNFKSPLNFFPIKFGDVEVKKEHDCHTLSYKNMICMTDHFTDQIDLSVEVSYGYGKCITSGIGLGIKESMLALKPEVTEVICYEKNKEIIDLFYMMANYSNFNTTKIKIIHGDAEDMNGLQCDCLFLDHYGFERDIYIQGSASRISYNNNSNIVWYWPAVRHYFSHIEQMNLPLTKETFYNWASRLYIKNMPCSLSDDMIDLISDIRKALQE